MKKILCILCVVLSVTTITPVIFSVAKEKTEFLVLGDSIARGYGVTATTNYAYLISNEYGYNLNNDSVNGASTSDLLTLLNDNETVISNVKEADIINISIGGNDVIKQKDDILNYYNNKNYTALAQLISTTISTIQTNLDSIVARIISLNQNSKIILQTLYTTNIYGLQITLEMFIDTFNKSYTNIQEKYTSNVCVADVRTAFKNSTETLINTEDNIHPNINGHRVIANTIETQINNYGYEKATQTTTTSTNILADCNNDGEVDIKDCLTLKLYLSKNISEISTANADVNKDGYINVKDVLSLINLLAK